MGQTVEEYLQEVEGKLNVFERMTGVLSPHDERLDISNRLNIEMIRSLQDINAQLGILTENAVVSGGGSVVDDVTPKFYIRRYALDTAVAQDPNPTEIKDIPGDSLTFFTDGDMNGITFTLDTPANDWVTAGEFGNPYIAKAPFKKVYLSWTAQAGKYLRVHIGNRYLAEGNSSHVSWALGELDSTSPQAPTFATITAASGLVIAASTLRKGLVLSNDDVSDIWLAFGTGATAVVGSGVRLNSGGAAYVVDYTNYYSGAIYAIHNAGAVNRNMGIQEFR